MTLAPGGGGASSQLQGPASEAGAESPALSTLTGDPGAAEAKLGTPHVTLTPPLWKRPP